MVKGRWCIRIRTHMWAIGIVDRSTEEESSRKRRRGEQGRKKERKGEARRRENSYSLSVFSYSDGSRYVGEWRENQPDGQMGKLYMKTGYSYEGSWQQGKVEERVLGR